MDLSSNAIKVSKPARRFYGLITDRVFVTLVLAFSALAILDQSQAYQSLHFALQSMTGIAPFFSMPRASLAIGQANLKKTTTTNTTTTKTKMPLITGPGLTKLIT